MIGSLLFEKRFWCRHLCPVGGMNGLFAKLAISELVLNHPLNELSKLLRRRLLENAPRYSSSPYVCPAILNHDKPLSPHAYYNAWRRILDRAGVPRVGTHGIRHRSATDIANSGIPVKVGMALTAHKTVAMFMRYVHTEDDPVRKAADLVATRRKSVVSTRQEPNQVAT